MTKNVFTTAASVAILSSTAVAGDFITDLVSGTPSTSQSKSLADYITGGTKLYKNSSNPYIQEVSLSGRAHFQYNYSDGELDDQDFSGGGEELRRLRTTAKIKFLNKFEAKASVNLENGGFRGTSLRYNSLDEAKLTYKAGDILGVEDVSFSYGRHKHTFGGEVHQSSKKIKTVERSNISNFFFDSSRPTGVQIAGSKNGYDVLLGIFSANETGRDITGDWNDLAYYINVQKDGWNLDLFFNDNDGEDDEFDNFKWGASVAYETEYKGWNVLLNGLYGQSSDDENDDVWGLIILPSKFIIEDKLEAVFRYQYAGSSGNQINAGSGSRGVRAVASRDGSPISSGDNNHTFYAGLNYYFLGNNSKLLLGIEYETLDGDGPENDLDATTLWAAYRFFF